MDNNEFVTFRKFNDEFSAEEFSKILTEKNIENQVINNSPIFDASFANNEIHNEFLVNIKSLNFTEANNLLSTYFENQIEDVNPDYHLFTYSDFELIEIVQNSDEWNEYDVALSKKILKDRNIDINYQKVEENKNNKLNELSKPEKAKSWHIVVGYIIAFLGGILGIFYGWYLTNFKKTLPNGVRIYNFQESDRVHGKFIMYIGIVSFTLWLLNQYFGIL